MAQALADGTDDYSLTLFYGAKTAADLAFRSRLDALAAQMPGKFKVVYVTEKEEEGCEHGFVNLALVKKYVDGDFTVMMCGPSAMYAFQDKELRAPRSAAETRQERGELRGTVRDAAPAVYDLTVHIGFDTFKVKADAGETLLVAMERAGLKVPSKCPRGRLRFLPQQARCRQILHRRR